MRRWKLVYLGILLPALAVGLGVWNPFGKAAADTRAGRPATPTYRVDPFWPKPLPSDATHISPTTGMPKPWVTGEVAGTCVDSQDHVFTVNRGNLIAPEDVTAVASPPVLEFDREGDLVNAWGNRATMATGLHGCFVDYQDNVWIAGNGDGIVQKFSHDGSTLLLQIGTKGKCDWPANNNACGNSANDPSANQSHTLLNEPADIAVDPANGEIYVADGYGNHRVVVFDKNGQWLRQWGSPGTGPGQFQPADGGHPHCVVLANDGLVYTCDRGSDRLQVFDKMGNLQRIIPVKPGTGVGGLGTAGSAWDVAFSPDWRQTFMFDADGGNEIVWTFDRAAASILSGFGRPGHQAGEFTFLHTVTTDSKGNLFTGETINGRRIQKWVRHGADND